MMKTFLTFFIVSALLIIPRKSSAQFVSHVYGNYCIGASNTFVYQGPGTLLSWYASNGGTITSQWSTIAEISWSSAVVNGYIIAYYEYEGDIYDVSLSNINIGTSVQPSVSISATSSNTCSGASVTFTATPVNGGTSPSYSWYINGNYVSGVTANTFSSASLTNGQQVTCVMSSNSPCVSSSTATSNAVTVTVNQAATMSVSISGETTVCQGNSAAFGASVTNATGTLSYQWKRNGTNVTSDVGGTPAYALVLNSTNNGDIISCYVTSNGCANPATSNSLTIANTQPATFSVSVNPNKVSYCNLEQATFTAGSSHPATNYQWYVGNVPVPNQTASTFIVTAENTGQLQNISVTADLASTPYCFNNTSASANSQNIPFNIVSSSIASVSINIPSVVQLNVPATFTASPVNGGTSPSYQWKLNNTVVPGATTPTFTPTISSGSEFQTVSVTMNSNALCTFNAAEASKVIEIVSEQWENLNYVRVHSVAKPSVDNWVQVDGLPIGEKFQSTTYMDGLGRSIQSVDKGISSSSGGTWKDIVRHFEYDAAGRETKYFLPYATSDLAGKFKTDAASAQPGYVRSFFGEASDAPTYSEVLYDESPLNRIIKSMMPGKSWGGEGKGMTTSVDFNKSDEKVHIWTLDYSTAAIPVSSSTSVYPTGTLNKSISQDQNNNKVISYTDFSGNLVLKKVQKDAAPGQEHAGWVSTYYVYDDFNQLRYTISPKVVEYLDSHSWSLTQDMVDELCYTYRYDEKGRMIVKKQPGVAETWMVYDKKDRLVFSQDGNQRANNQWMTTLYDVLGREALTGITTYSATLDNMQSEISTITSVSTNPVTGIPVDRILTGNAIAGSFAALRTVTIETEFESATGGEMIAEIVAGPAGSDGQTYIVEGVPVNMNPIPQGANFLMLTTTYYDTYDYPDAKPFTSTYSFAYSTGGLIEPTVTTNRTTGMVTGEKIRVLDNDNNPSNDKFLLSTAYYDERGRELESLVDNIKNATDYQVSQYDYTGKLMSAYTSHNDGATTHTIISKNEYDKVGNLLKFSKNFNNSFYKQLAEFTYDELGQVKTKRIAPGYTGANKTEMEALTYDYNIHGWLTGINKSYALSNNTYTQGDHFFGLYLGYDNKDNVFANPLLNGNITGVIWRSAGDNHPRKFDYEYDRLGRFTKALFTQKNKPSETTWSSTTMDFTTAVEYEDNNGNLKSMKHMGGLPGVTGGVAIDDLRYFYLSTQTSGLAGNKLGKVDDLSSIGSTNGLLNDFKDLSNSQDYWYDVNGNLVKDLNKGIKNGSADGVTYNYMNKPVKIEIEGKSIIEFMYDAAGEKLKKDVKYADNSRRITTYINDYVYEEFIPANGNSLGDQLQFVLHEEGRLKIITPHVLNNANDYELNAGAFGINSWPDGKQGVFEYFIKDNLGNARMVLTEEFQKEQYLATMEANAAGQEEPLFGQVNANGSVSANNELAKTRVSNTIWPGNGTDVAKLTATSPDKVMGPNIMLKVMAGDEIKALVDYFYVNNNTNGSNSLLNSAVNSLVSALSTGKANSIGKAQFTSVQNSLNPVNGDLANYLNSRDVTGTMPKAYLNVLFFDEQFRFIAPDPVTTNTGSTFRRVQSANDPNGNRQATQWAPQNGWVFVFVSNESNEPVYFDNLRVFNTHGRIAEESHYYPYGQKIAAISSKAFNKLGNDYNYQGGFAEHEDETGWDEFALRMYDPQIGRWNGADPYDEFASPYVGIGNDPINFTDPSGGSISAGGWGSILGAVAVGVGSYWLADKLGAENPGAWAALGSFLGAGLGYGFGESAFGDGSNGYAGMLQHTAAFYNGFFGGEGAVQFANGMNGKAAGNFAWTPNIWGSLGGIFHGGGGKGTPESAIQPPYIPLPNIRSNGPRAGFSISTINIIRVITPPVPPNRRLVEIPIAFRNFNITQRVSFMDPSSYYDSRISDEQFNAGQNLVSGILASVGNGRLISGTLRQTVYNYQLPVNLIPTVASGAFTQTNLSTGRRSSSVSPRDISPVQGVGNTVFQNYANQVDIIAGQMGRRLGIRVARGNTTLVRNQSNMQFIFNGVVQRATRVIFSWEIVPPTKDSPR